MVPYEILRCAWPRPVVESGRQWVSDPDWDAPLTHIRPQPEWRKVAGDDCWTIDWRELFRAGEAFGGEMCGFHVVFQIRVNTTGRLIFYSDDGCIIRRDGCVIYSDRASHPAIRNELDVEVGDRLEIAQWQLHRDWIWGARIDGPACEVTPLVASWLPVVEQRLRNPNGPPLKMYCHGGTPLRTVVALYSMILNGYAPSSIHFYGDYQWPHTARQLFSALLPFAQVSAFSDVIGQIGHFGGSALVELARKHWFVMKCCVSLLCDPSEFCRLRFCFRPGCGLRRLLPDPVASRFRASDPQANRRPQHRTLLVAAPSRSWNDCRDALARRWSFESVVGLGTGFLRQPLRRRSGAAAVAKTLFLSAVRRFTWWNLGLRLRAQPMWLCERTLWRRGPQARRFGDGNSRATDSRPAQEFEPLSCWGWSWRIGTQFVRCLDVYVP